MKKTIGAGLGLLLALCAMAGLARATDYTWDGEGATTNWDDSTNWVGDAGFPNATTDTAIFTGTAQPTPGFTGEITVGQLIITNTTVGWTISGDTLTLPDGGKLLNYADNWPNGGTWTVGSALNLLGDAYISFLRSDGNTRTFRVSGQIAGSNTLYLAGTRTSLIALSGNNTGFVGTVICTTGIVAMANVNAFGANATPVEIRSGVTLQNPSGTKPLRAVGNFSMNWGFTYSGPIELVSNATFTIATGGGNACTVNGAISGTGNVTAQLNARLEGTAANTYTGLTTIVGLPVYLNKTAGLDAVPGPLLVGSASGSGRAQLSNSNQINDASIVSLWNTNSAYGALRLSGFSETIGGLATAGGLAATAFVENSHATAAATLTINNSADCAYAGVFRDGSTGVLNVVKAGPAALFLNGPAGSNAWTGALTVNQGVLGGTGTIACATTVNAATLAPGQGAGTLTIGHNLALATNAALNFELGAIGAANDLLAVAGNLTLNGTLNVTALSGFSPTADDTWRLVDYGGALDGSGLTLGAVPAGYTFAIETNTAGQVNLRVVSVDEPPASPDSPLPADAATGILPATSLDWADSARALGYKVYLWTNGQSKPLVPNATVAASQWTPPGALQYSTAYNWQIVATNTFGATTGSVWSFTTRTGLPDAPVYLAPANGAGDVDPATAFDWQDAYLAAGYDVYLWLSADSPPATPTASPANSLWAPPVSLQPGAAYSWQVIATNGYGATTGAVWTLTTGTPTNYVWSGAGADNNWDTPANWTNNSGYPQRLYDTATLTGTNQTAANLNGDRSVGTVVFTNTPASFTVSNSVLTLKAGGLIRDWNPPYANNNEIIASAINLQGDATFGTSNDSWNNGLGWLRFNGQITGSGTLTLDGSGRIQLSGNNAATLTGPIVVMSGKVSGNFGSTNAGTTFYAGRWLAMGSSAESFVIAGNAAFDSWGGYPHATGPISVLSNATLTVNTGGGNPTYIEGAISGPGSLRTEGNGGLTWEDVYLGGSGTNTLSGGVTVYAGRLNLRKSGGATAIPCPLFVGTGVAAAQVVWMASNQVSDDVVITLFNTDAASGGLSLNGCVDTVGGVVSVGAASGTAFVENGLGAGPATLTVSNAADGVYAGTMRDGGLALNIVKTGPGRWTLNGPCANTGTWTIDGGTLGGTGALSGPVTVNAAAIAPGDGGPGTLTMSGNLTLSENAALDFEIGTPGAPGSDLIDGVNNLVLDGTLNVTALPGLGALPPGSVWRLINYHGWLANNGLKIGARPPGVALWVETGTPGQVNLMSLPTGVMMIVR